MTQTIGAALVIISVVGILGYGVRRFFCGLLAEDEAARTDLAREAHPCAQTLLRFHR
jgi:hypothetical protein